MLIIQKIIAYIQNIILIIYDKQSRDLSQAHHRNEGDVYPEKEQVLESK